MATRHGQTFVRDDAASAAILGAVNNNNNLNYAPATSSSELELFFTRVDHSGPGISPSGSGLIARQPFQTPARLSAISGFVEAATLSPDGRSLYFHKREGGRFVLYRVTR